jgi:LysM repeat protein
MVGLKTDPKGYQNLWDLTTNWRIPMRRRGKWFVVALIVLFLIVLMAAPAYADGTHVVRPGENLRRIAMRYGTTVTALMQANGLRNPHVIYVGQRLRIPTGATSSAPTASGVYVVRRGDTLFSIARRFGVSQTALMQANGIRDARFIWVGQRLRIPRSGAVVGAAQSQRAAFTPGQRVHVVAQGETLFSIAMRYGVTVDSIVRANGLQTASHIITGQRLVIPAGGNGAASPSAAPRKVAAPTTGKWIEIDVSRQRLVAYEGDRPVFSAVVSTGKPSTPTVLGRFAIRTKLRSQRMRGPGYDLPNVPWVMYFYGAYAIHGTYWHNDFGRPVSHGCVNMRQADAQWLYNWAPIGTPVVVHR